MKNRFKIAAKRLIVNVASSHGMAPLDVLAIHKYARTQKSYNPASVFGTCLYAYKEQLYPKTIKRFLKGKTSEALKETQYLKARDKFVDGRYGFAFDFINNFYVKQFIALFNDEEKKQPVFGYTQLNTALTKPQQIVREQIREKSPTSSSIIIPTSKEVAALTNKLPSPVIFDSIKWTKQQANALKLIYAWLRDSNRKPIFRLFGYAGVGKTFLAKAIAAFVYNEAGKRNVPKGDVLFAAYTGKAASVMRRNECVGASTLHSLLYKPIIDPGTGRCTGFMLNGDSVLAHASVLIVDEVSMVNEELGKDAEAFNIPILCLGDPGQLDPIEGYGYFTSVEPDVMLTDIQRQAKDNPIIHLATRVREGKSLKTGKYGSSRVIDTLYTPASKMAKFDQIIVGRNDTRRSINQTMRKHYGYFKESSMYPVEGERLICLKNNKTNGLYNGTMWVAGKSSIRKVLIPKFKGSYSKITGSLDVLAFKVTSEDELTPEGTPVIIDTQCSPHMFNLGLPEPDFRERISCDEFAYGYAATVHKMQGSQCRRVFLKDESAAFGRNAWKHLYTGITRAIEDITIALA